MPPPPRGTVSSAAPLLPPIDRNTRGGLGRCRWDRVGGMWRRTGCPGVTDHDRASSYCLQIWSQFEECRSVRVFSEKVRGPVESFFLPGTDRMDVSDVYGGNRGSGSYRTQLGRQVGTSKNQGKKHSKLTARVLDCRWCGFTACKGPARWTTDSTAAALRLRLRLRLRRGMQSLRTCPDKAGRARPFLNSPSAKFKGVVASAGMGVDVVCRAGHGSTQRQLRGAPTRAWPCRACAHPQARPATCIWFDASPRLGCVHCHCAIASIT